MQILNRAPMTNRSLVSLEHLSVLFIMVVLILTSCGGNPTEMPAASDTPVTAIETTPTLTQTITETGESVGLLVISMTEGGTSHLFAFSPTTLGFTRLTAGEWDDINPAISPDGTQIAYSSRRNGYWDIYLLDLGSGELTRITDTPVYEASPSWSPDGQWLVYESYMDGNLELYVHSVKNPAQAPIRLTNHQAADYAPSWSPIGRQIAFVSNRDGQDDIWLANLDVAGDDRYTNLSRSLEASEAHPSWSMDGTSLAWATTDSDGVSSIQVLDMLSQNTPSIRAGSGNWPVWQGNGDFIVAISSTNQWLLSGFHYPGGELSLALTPLLGTVRGLTWLPTGLPSPLAEPFQKAAAYIPADLYVSKGPVRTGIPSGRASLVTLEYVQAPYPQLHDAASDSFQALRQRIAVFVGWDVLASLSNAYVPLTTPLEPAMGDDWLYTGRAFTLNPLLANAGWIAAVREEKGGETYWRVYLRTLAQDGSQGEPLQRSPWNFNARYAGDPAQYDQGGGIMDPIPSGYWFDMTALAAEYGWHRLPALPNWRTYLIGSRFTEFAFTQGLDWRTAMLELYPVESLVTPTIVVPPTRTPTATPWRYSTTTPSLTPTARPTFTDSP